MFRKRIGIILISGLLLLGLGSVCLGETPPGPPDQAKIEAELKKGLDQLVATNVITVEQELAVIVGFQKFHPNPPDQAPEKTFNALPSGGPRPTGQAGQPADNPLLDALMKEKTITPEQAQAIAKVLPKPPAPPLEGFNNVPPPPGSGSAVDIKAPTAVYNQSGKQIAETKKNYTAAAANQSVVTVTNAGVYTLTGSIITKTGDTSATENSDFYGLNAAVLAEKSAKINLSNCTITTNSRGGQGAFATGSGSVINLTNVTIKTTADSSRGVDATFAGTVIATNCNITTDGAHCAALATDRGDGTIKVFGGTMTTSGQDSPPIYCTGTFNIADTKLNGIGSEAAVIEGANSIALTNCELWGAKKRGVMIYQSMSGDAEGTKGIFTMTGGSLTAAEGPLFYVTNSTGTIELNKVKASAASGVLIEARTDRWGHSGSNGGTAIFTAENEVLRGDLVCDELSGITATLKNTTSMTGAIDSGHTGSVTLNLDKSSIWHVTGNSYLSGFSDTDITLSNIDDNGFTIFYDASLKANSWLGNKTYQLSDGGKLTPQ